jgi:hypothetical protein
MDFEFSPQEKAFQKEIHDFLKKEINEGVVAETESLQGLGPYGKELLQKMGQRRLLAPAWPEKYGGRGLSQVTQGIVYVEMGYFQAPWPIDGLVIGTTLLHSGSEEQKEKYLTGISRGEIEFALGYTEPEAGSDLASVQLRAVKSGDTYILSGQKVFNTETHYADYHWLMVRTDSSVPKHKGLSIFIVDLKSPGITIRPLFTSAGLRTNEVFYDDVRVPHGNLVGKENHGWEYAASALGSERILWTGDMQFRFNQLVKYLQQDKRYQNNQTENPWILDKLAELETKLHIATLLSYKAAATHDRGLPLTYEASLSKLYGSEVRQQLFSIAMQILGHYGELSEGSTIAPMKGVIQREYIDSCRWTIIAGSSEIQRTIIARSLGLPRK